jgi:hypothetical protein
MDLIRTIETSATIAELNDWLFGRKSARLYFSARPRQADVGDLMFIAFHGRIIAVGAIIEMDDEPDADDLYWITLQSVRRMADADLEYRGYASIKYVDRLAKQFDGRYAKLAKRLSRIATEYRSKLPARQPKTLARKAR